MSKLEGARSFSSSKPQLNNILKKIKRNKLQTPQLYRYEVESNDYELLRYIEKLEPNKTDFGQYRYNIEMYEYLFSCGGTSGTIIIIHMYGKVDINKKMVYLLYKNSLDGEYNIDSFKDDVYNSVNKKINNILLSICKQNDNLETATLILQKLSENMFATTLAEILKGFKLDNINKEITGFNDNGGKNNIYQYVVSNEKNYFHCYQNIIIHENISSKQVIMLKYLNMLLHVINTHMICTSFIYLQN